MAMVQRLLDESFYKDDTHHAGIICFSCILVQNTKCAHLESVQLVKHFPSKKRATILSLLGILPSIPILRQQL